MAEHRTRKRFGQHFLADEYYINQIVDAISPAPDDAVVEIGPGMSALTRPLLQRLDYLQVVEIDRDLVQRLQAEQDPGRLTVHACDALDFDFRSVGERFRVVGNLPYNISSPLLFHLVEFRDRVIDQHFMLQKEVVDRMAAQPGHSDYGRLSVMLQYHYQIDPLFEVPPEAFEPPPKVQSAVVRMIPLGAERPRARDERIFAQLVAQAFTQRRKMLRKSLSSLEIDFSELSIDETQRPEELSCAQFIELADYVLAKQAQH